MCWFITPSMKSTGLRNTVKVPNLCLVFLFLYLRHENTPFNQRWLYILVSPLPFFPVIQIISFDNHTIDAGISTSYAIVYKYTVLFEFECKCGLSHLRYPLRHISFSSPNYGSAHPFPWFWAGEYCLKYLWWIHPGTTFFLNSGAVTSLFGFVSSAIKKPFSFRYKTKGWKEWEKGQEFNERRT